MTSIIDETLTFVGYVRYSCVTANHGYVRYLCVTTNPLSNGGSIANLTLNINYYSCRRALRTLPVKNLGLSFSRPGLPWAKNLSLTRTAQVGSARTRESR